MVLGAHPTWLAQGRKLAFSRKASTTSNESAVLPQREALSALEVASSAMQTAA